MFLVDNILQYTNLDPIFYDRQESLQALGINHIAVGDSTNPQCFDIFDIKLNPKGYEDGDLNIDIRSKLAISTSHPLNFDILCHWRLQAYNLLNKRYTQGIALSVVFSTIASFFLVNIAGAFYSQFNKTLMINTVTDVVKYQMNSA